MQLMKEKEVGIFKNMIEKGNEFNIKFDSKILIGAIHRYNTYSKH